jgi:recombination protein RecT
MAEKLATVKQVKTMLARDDVKERFNDILGSKAPQFMASLVNVVAGSSQLAECEPNSIMASAFVAASFDLPIDSNLGFAAIVPYKKNTYNYQTKEWESQSFAQFQMMYKGFVQLAIRSGQYEKMSCSEVYQDELLEYNPITGECKFTTDFSECTQRLNGEADKIIGYYAWFKLHSGFVKELFMTKSEIYNHASKYSQSFRMDISKNKKSSRWSTDFDAMAKKTVLKLLLSKWGVLSVEMQKAIQDDQKIYNSDGTGDYADNKDNRADDVAADPFVEVKAEESEGV